LNRLPADADFVATTGFKREEWQTLLENMSEW
jgi:hypothetical protein